MKSYKEYVSLIINEGIIKVDAKLLNYMYDILTFKLLNKIIPQLNNKPNHQSIAKDLLPPNIQNKDIYELEYNNNGLISKFNYIVGAKSLDDDTGAYFKLENKILTVGVIFEHQFRMMINEWLSNQNDIKDNLLIVIDYKKNQVEHELGHLIEYLIYKKRYSINNEVKHKKSKGDELSDYFTSEIEYEPMIISVVRNFITKVKQYKIKNKTPMTILDYKEMMREVLSGEQYSDFDNLFVFYSKKITPQRYKIVVRKVHTELINNIPNLLANGYLKEY